MATLDTTRASAREKPEPVIALPAGLLPGVKVAPRGFVETIIEELIETLDAADGDADLEDDNEDCCPAGDDGCAPVWRHGIRHWGSHEEGAADYALAPTYGIDQSKGPSE